MYREIICEDYHKYLKFTAVSEGLPPTTDRAQRIKMYPKRNHFEDLPPTPKFITSKEGLPPPPPMGEHRENVNVPEDESFEKTYHQHPKFITSKKAYLRRIAEIPKHEDK